MVNFICDACGQTIKKQKVEKHYEMECRNCSVLSCIDCGKDFPGDSYASHTSCISEAEKYQGKLYKGKEKVNKGERKQQQWLEQVRIASLDNGSQDPCVRKLMAKITSYSNVPRKEKKFKKFCENSVNIRDQTLLEKLWKTFSGARDANVSTNTSKNHQNSSINHSENIKNTGTIISFAENDNLENPESMKTKNSNKELDESYENKKKESKKEKKKKRKLEECVNGTENNDSGIVERKNKKKRKAIEQQVNGSEGEMAGENKKKKKQNNKTEKNETEREKQGCEKAEIGQDEQNAETPGKFRWETVIKKVLKSASENEMSVKKLRKKVIAEYVAHGSEARSRTEQELQTLFNKKLHKNPKVKVHKEKAKYCK